MSIEDGLNNKNVLKDVTTNSNRNLLVPLHIGDLDVSKGYQLVAEAVTGPYFKDIATLKIESKTVSIFIQIDKAIYKPGSMIKFRVIVLDHELKPVKLRPDRLLNIHIIDAADNRIKQWLNVTTNKGIFSSELQLSELPVLGKWKLNAQIGIDKKTKEIEVAEYVLPKFSVSIDSPPIFSAKNDKIRAIIRSRYTYSQMVIGEAIVSLRSQRSDRDNVVKTVRIDGKGSVEFDIENELKPHFYDEQEIYDLKATVIEELTGRNQSTSKMITLYRYRYKINPLDFSYNFIPGLPINLSV